MNVPAPFAPTRVSGYDFGAPLPAGGWTGTGQSFGWLTHLGSDYGTKAGEPIIAPFPGVAKFEQGLVGYGNRLTLTLANGWKFIFGHVAQGVNGNVNTGSRIGTTGRNIGSAQGSVTLVEVHNPQGIAVNPHNLLDPIFGGKATAESLFGAVQGQILSRQESTAPSPPMPNFQAAWETLINDLQAAPSEASRNTQAQVTVFKPVADFFNRVGDLIQPKHLWTTMFVVLGAGMVTLGIVLYFKSDEVVAASKEAVKVGATAAV